MTFYVYYPDHYNIKEKEKIRKYKKELENRAISLGVPKEHLTPDYKVLEQSKEHVVVDLQKPTNPTIKEFSEILGIE